MRLIVLIRYTIFVNLPMVLIVLSLIGCSKKKLEAMPYKLKPQYQNDIKRKYINEIAKIIFKDETNKITNNIFCVVDTRKSDISNWICEINESIKGDQLLPVDFGNWILKIDLSNGKYLLKQLWINTKSSNLD